MLKNKQRSFRSTLAWAIVPYVVAIVVWLILHWIYGTAYQTFSYTHGIGPPAWVVGSFILFLAYLLLWHTPAYVVVLLLDAYKALRGRQERSS